jgi:hypothetical protein
MITVTQRTLPQANKRARSTSSFKLLHSMTALAVVIRISRHIFHEDKVLLVDHEHTPFFE